MTTKKAKKMTFRQRLRADAEDKLQQMESTVRLLATDALKSEGTTINPFDVMRLASGTQTKSLRYRLIGELANEKEAELEALYNKQQDLPLKAGSDGE